MAGQIFSLLGRSGAGKGVVANLLSPLYKIPIVSTGDIFRHRARTDSKIRKYLEEGKFIPAEVGDQIIFNHIQKISKIGGFILDGAPRNTSQTLLLWDILSKGYFIHVDTEREICKNRLLLRRRADDTPSRIDSRLREFCIQTNPAIRLIKRRCKKPNRPFIHIDGNQDLQAVLLQVKEQLREIGI
mgnify:CR=1 FL=1